MGLCCLAQESVFQSKVYAVGTGFRLKSKIAALLPVRLFIPTIKCVSFIYYLEFVLIF